MYGTVYAPTNYTVGTYTVLSTYHLSVGPIQFFRSCVQSDGVTIPSHPAISPCDVEDSSFREARTAQETTHAKLSTRILTHDATTLDTGKKHDGVARPSACYASNQIICYNHVRRRP